MCSRSGRWNRGRRFNAYVQSTKSPFRVVGLSRAHISLPACPFDVPSIRPRQGVNFQSPILNTLVGVSPFQFSIHIPCLLNITSPISLLVANPPSTTRNGRHRPRLLKIARGPLPRLLARPTYPPVDLIPVRLCPLRVRQRREQHPSTLSSRLSLARLPRSHFFSP
jgi:hypothetical protein